MADRLHKPFPVSEICIQTSTLCIFPLDSHYLKSVQDNNLFEHANNGTN